MPIRWVATEMIRRPIIALVAGASLILVALWILSVVLSNVEYSPPQPLDVVCILVLGRPEPGTCDPPDDRLPEVEPSCVQEAAISERSSVWWLPAMEPSSSSSRTIGSIRSSALTSRDSGRAKETGSWLGPPSSYRRYRGAKGSTSAS